MRFTRVSIALVTVLFAGQTAMAQFGQSNRLADLTLRLSRDASSVADSTYQIYSNSPRGSRAGVEAVMLTQQFAASAQIFSRMVVDRRRNQDLREAFTMLQDLAGAVERNNQQRNNWQNVQRTMIDLARELNAASSDDGGNQGPDRGRGGSMTWRGRVDDDVRIVVRGGTAEVETIGGTAYPNSQPNFTNSLPSRRVTVRLTVRRARGEVYIEEQPSRENNFAAVIRIKDTRGGASDYEFELSW